MDPQVKKTPIEFEIWAEKFKSIGHPTRLAILHLLCKCGYDRLTVKCIYNTLELDQPNTSRHLSILKKSGLLVRKVEDGKIFYSLFKEDSITQCIRQCFIN